MSANWLKSSDNKYFFVCPIEPRDDEDYYESLKSAMQDYSCRFFSINQTPYEYWPIVHILHALTRFPSNICQDDQGGTGSKFKERLGRYLVNEYLEEYKEDDIPLLYFMILTYLTDGLDKMGYHKKREHLCDEAVRCHLLGLKCYKLHNNNPPNSYSKILSNQLERLQLTMLPKLLLNYMTTRSLDYALRNMEGETMPHVLSQRDSYKNAAFLIKESFKSFVINHKDYSIYHRDLDDSFWTGFVFVTEMSRRMIQYDIPRKSSKHQKRYKYLLKRAIKSLEKYIDCPPLDCCERYGLYHSYLGYYYAVFSRNENHLKKARNYLIKGMKIIQSVSKYLQSLPELYDFLIWVLRGMCHIDECIEIMRISIDFYDYYQRESQRQYYIDEIEQMNVLQRIIKLIGRPAKKCINLNSQNQLNVGPFYWKQVLEVREKGGAEITKRIFGPQMSACVHYFKEDKYYRVMKNIVAMKECNYSKCRAKNIKLEICSKCKSVYYCCKEHQKLDWKLKHRFECKQYDTRNVSMTCKNIAQRWKGPALAYSDEKGLQTMFVDVLS